MFVFKNKIASLSYKVFLFGINKDHCNDLFYANIRV
jgi:hypothetical protein